MCACGGAGGVFNRECEKGRNGEGWDESIVGLVLSTFWLLELARRISDYRDEAAQSSCP